MRTTTNPISVNVGFLGNYREIVPGSSPELYVAINNRGPKNAVIDVYIEFSDENSSALMEWINPKRVRLEVDAGQQRTVSFKIKVPERAWAHNYLYDIVLDSPDHYPEYTPLSYPQILKVQPAPAVLKYGGEDPCFFLSPTTNSAEPRRIKAGETFDVEVLVENRTALVDRFYVICSELKPEYFSVHYPEVRDQYGLVVESDGLELNPGKSGVAKLKFHPPYNAAAGNFFPTIRLASVNNPRLNLLDVVYLHIPPAYELEAGIETIQDRVKDPKSETGEYLLKLSNQGNLERNLVVKPHALGWKTLSFSVDSDYKTLAPGAMSQIQMQVRPLGRWWNRPFYGAGRTFRFEVELEDVNNLPIPPERPEAQLVWEPYPKKWFRLVAILLVILLACGLVALAITLWNVFFKKPPAPKVVDFAPTKTSYKETNREVVQLNWTIENAKNLGQIVLKQQGGGRNEVKTYDFKTGIPRELSIQNPTQASNYCTFLKRKDDSSLICKGITMTSSQAGQYEFELQAFDRKDLNKPSSTAKTDTISVIPASQPKISEFFSPQPEYTLSDAAKPVTVLLNWDIANLDQASQIKLVGLTKEGTVATPVEQFDVNKGKLPGQLKSFCKFERSLSCKNFPISIGKPGIYTFRLMVKSNGGGDDKDLAKLTDNIQVKSAPVVQISPRPGAPIVPVPAAGGSKSSPAARNSKAASQPQEPINVFIPPSSQNYPTYRPQPQPQTAPPRQASPPVDNSLSQQQAEYIRKGLNVASEAERIPRFSDEWQQVRNCIVLLERGMRLEAAAQQSGVPMSTLNSLIEWGQSQNLPQKAAVINQSPPTSSPRSTLNPGTGNFGKPPEPLWGSSDGPIGSFSKKSSQSSGPLR